MGLTTKEDFIEITLSYLTCLKDINKLYYLNVHFEGTSIYKFNHLMYAKYIISNFTDEGVDWINWWVFEKSDDQTLKAYDKDYKEIPMETIDDLWNYVKQYRK